MGKYINVVGDKLLGTSYIEKVIALERAGAKAINVPEVWTEGLICVVNNGFFGAAAYIYSENEMEEFKNVKASTQWLLWKEAKKHID